MTIKELVKRNNLTGPITIIAGESEYADIDEFEMVCTTKDFKGYYDYPGDVDYCEIINISFFDKDTMLDLYDIEYPSLVIQCTYCGMEDPYTPFEFLNPNTYWDGYEPDIDELFDN